MNKKPNHGSKINLQLNFNVLPLHVVIEKINLMKMKISTRVGQKFSCNKETLNSIFSFQSPFTAKKMFISHFSTTKQTVLIHKKILSECKKSASFRITSEAFLQTEGEYQYVWLIEWKLAIENDELCACSFWFENADNFYPSNRR